MRAKGLHTILLVHERCFHVSSPSTGLAGTLSGQPYEAWAEAIQPAQTGFVERKYLVHRMRRHCEVAVQVAMPLGESYCSALAGEAVAPFTLTHEKIAQVIGTSRETVTRLLSWFKKKGLIRWKGCDLVLMDRSALERSAANY